MLVKLSDSDSNAGRFENSERDRSIVRHIHKMRRYFLWKDKDVCRCTYELSIKLGKKTRYIYAPARKMKEWVLLLLTKWLWHIL